MVQALAPNGANHALHISSLPDRSRSGQYFQDLHIISSRSEFPVGTAVRSFATQPNIHHAGAATPEFLARGFSPQYDRAVRHAWAVWLLAMFSFSPIVPTTLTDAKSNLPACCRRAGVHHCARHTADEQESSSGPAVRAIRHACPYFPATTSVPGQSNTVLPEDSRAIFASLLSHPAVQAQTEARYHVSFSPSHQKRGPPAPLS
jgi:hypothetical protein